MKEIRKYLKKYNLFYLTIILTVISIPFSKFVLSISMIILGIIWLFENDLKDIWQKLIKNKEILIFTGIFFIHIIWLFNTQNFKYAFHDLGNKVIILIYPLIIGTSKKIANKKLKKIIVWFSIAVFVSTLISIAVLVQLINIPYKEIRDISIFTSHIRLSLLVNLAIFFLGYIIFSKKFLLKKYELILFPLMIIELILFLYLLKSLTGIIIFIITFILAVGFISFKIKDLILRLFIQLALVAFFLVISSYLTHSIARFYTKKIIDKNNLDKYTQSGNKYQHSFNNKQVENGEYIWLYISEKELKEQWNKRSNLSYNGKDKKGQFLSYTLKRYLTSKGYRKDSSGISKLTSMDIKNIEQGMANYLFADKYAIYPKIYQVLWQIDVYRKGENPAGNSITQRIEFLKSGINIIKNNFWFGTGTGDVQDSFDKQYTKDKSQLPGKWRLRTHNQYVTFFISFGLTGFILFIFFLLYPVIKLKAYKSYLFSVFFIIILLSFINEDTLEVQVGITIFSFFYSLFLFGISNNETRKYAT